MSAPLWQSIRDQLVAEISSGQFAPGARLPTEAALAARFGVNRHTIRHAIATMREDGLVRSRRGAGVFVTAAPVDYRVGQRTRFTQPLAEQGHSSARRVLRLEEIPATDRHAGHLDIAVGDPVLVLESIGLIDSHPATHGQGVFPLERVPRLPAALEETSSITAALSAVGVTDYSRAWTRISAVRAAGAIARHLEVTDGSPLIRTRSLNIDADGRPIELGRTYFCADRIELLVEASDL